jgi:GT2 family glycosyltransferase
MTASIVIPLFTRWDLTAGCVQSLLLNTPDDTQFYLVDNGSTDEPATVRVDIRNERNEGFAHACNQGAALVPTEFVVFLNNDTIVQPGWLEALLEPFSDPDVGVTGGLLVYPSGEVQHAGVTVDFTRPAGFEAKNILHDLGVGPYPVQAVTGACLAIRTGLFRDLGGFDEGYWNGYEDVDLCLKAAAEGWTIMFTPDCRVVHLESQSGPERWKAVRENVQRLRNRWENP